MIKKLFQSEFIRNVSTLMTGTAIAQAIPILVSPILSRIYTPEDFGVLALYMSIGIVFTTIATGRYELAIMLPEKKRDASNLLVFSLFLALCTALFTLLLVVLFKAYIVDFFEEPEIGFWLYFLPLAVFFGGVYNAFNYWSTRHKTFKRNAAGRISQSSVMVGTNLSWGILRSGPSGLIVGYIAGMFTAGLVLAWKTLSSLKNLKVDISRKLIVENAKKYRNFPKINTPHAFIGSLQDNGIVYLIMAFFTKSVLGSYSFAYRIVTAPVGLIGSSIHQVFFQKATKAKQKGVDIQPMVLRLYRNLFLIGLPIFTLLFIFAVPVFSFVFGKEWEMAGEIARLIAPWLFLNFIASPVSSITVIVNRQKEGILLSVADIILKVVAILIGGLMGDIYLTFILMSILCGSLLLVSLYLFYKFAGVEGKSAY